LLGILYLMCIYLSNSRVDKEKVLQEIRILMSVNNPNIITLIHSWLDEDHVVFITELMTSGTLKKYLQKTKGSVRLKILKNWARQILNGKIVL
jgi:WNK lysine deficient protein kinase